MFSTFINILTVLISLATTSGVLVHDTRVDKATMAALALPSVMANYDTANKAAGFEAETHTHIERTSLSQTIVTLNGHTPGLQPRVSEDKKHLLQRHVSRGHHAFDSYNLPIV